MTLENYVESLGKVANMGYVNELSKHYLRYKNGKIEGTDSQFVKPLGRKINPEDPDMFLNETQAAVEHEIDNYQEKHKKEVKEAIDNYKGDIISDYSKAINVGLKATKEKVKSGLEKKLDELGDLSADERKKALNENLDLSMYEFLGMTLKDLDISEEYRKSSSADKELIETVDKLKQLIDLKDGEVKDGMADYMTDKYKLSSNYKNFRRDWNGLHKNSVGIYLRALGKKFMSRRYNVNTGLLKEVYGDYAGVTKMAPVAYEKAKN